MASNGQFPLVPRVMQYATDTEPIHTLTAIEWALARPVRMYGTPHVVFGNEEIVECLLQMLLPWDIESTERRYIFLITSVSWNTFYENYSARGGCIESLLYYRAELRAMRRIRHAQALRIFAQHPAYWQQSAVVPPCFQYLAEFWPF